MVNLRNNRGFSLISHLLMLTIILITLPFISYMLQSTETPSTKEELSVHQFFQFIRDDVIRSLHAVTTNEKLVLTVPSELNEQTVIYEQYGNVIRRQVDGEGFEIYVRNIAELYFQQLEFGFQIILTTSSGEQYEKTISFY
ncbi:competence type IV pilus minor pilin ComGF [Oceanobacillus sp. 1P07AA]|uniref:competence type IV pilus minor pilin ComGF n=1 Tax=Oceanobacillus sp. 1P07AA TaxID=3132293 RepID=UPI0039A6BBD4